MKLSKLAPILIIIVLGCLLYWVRNNSTQENQNDTSQTSRGLNRNPSKINYSKHARCRMACRDITEAEVKETLKEGKINYNKSQLQTSDCKKRYAVEDIVNGQRVRIVFAPCGNEVTVVTCIDLEKEWRCSCE